MCAPTIPAYQAPTASQLQNSGYPPYIPLNPQALESMAVSTDLYGFGLSNKMFAQNNPFLNTAQNQLQTVAQYGANGLEGNIAQMQAAAGGASQMANESMGLANQFLARTPYATSIVNPGLRESQLGAQEMQGNYVGGAGSTGGGSAGGGASADMTNLQNTYNALTSQASGQAPIDPMVQRQLMQSGLGQAANAFGAQSLGSGTAGQANAAANLGLNVQNYIQSQRQNALSGLGGLQGLASGVQQSGQQQVNVGEGLLSAQQGALGVAQGAQAQASALNQAPITSNMNMQSLASQLFPRLQYGLSGASVAQLGAQNTVNQNNWAQSQYAEQVSQNEFQANLGAEQAGLQSSSNSSALGTGASVAAAAAVAAFCGIAMRILGTRTRKWERFRHWLNYQAPRDLRILYRSNVSLIRNRLSEAQIEILRPIFEAFADKVDYVPANA
jgi:hypothetical protein